MLTIVDLHQEEELSSSSMRKVAGGEEPIPGGGNGSRSEAGPEGPDPGAGLIGGLLLSTAAVAGAVMSCAPIIACLL
jgi:hypothetical protein